MSIKTKSYSRAPKPLWFKGVKCDQCGAKFKRRKKLNFHINLLQKVPVRYFCTIGCKYDWINRMMANDI